MSDTECLQDLVGSLGWQVLKKKLHLVRDAALRDLATLKQMDEIVRRQALILAVDRVLGMPHEMIQGGKNAETEEKNER
jgi:hypothetical protein